jgi:DnaJ-class molecular chaperone
MKDYYEVLGVDRNAPQSTIKKAFRELAHKHHPDKGGDTDTFKDINQAYQILSQPEKRSLYDHQRSQPFASMTSDFYRHNHQGTHQQWSHMRYDTTNVSAWKIIKRVPLIAWLLLLPVMISVGLLSLILVLAFGNRKRS